MNLLDVNLLVYAMRPDSAHHVAARKWLEKTLVAEHVALPDIVCSQVKAAGNLVPDAYIAAIALEHGCTLITADQGFARFPRLRWKTPW